MKNLHTMSVEQLQQRVKMLVVMGDTCAATENEPEGVDHAEAMEIMSLLEGMMDADEFETFCHDMN